MISTPYDLLEKMMNGEIITIDDISVILNQKRDFREGVHIEYKHGDKIKSKNQGSKTIRKYLTGFANSNGGVLIIGFDEVKWEVTGAESPTKDSLVSWASTCIQQFISEFSPIPRFQMVAHPAGNILLVATYTAPNLIAIPVNGKRIYYFRVHDQTPQMPDYLVSDLLLGRRQHPYFAVNDLEVSNIHLSHNKNDYMWIDISLEILFENQSLYRVSDLRAGLVQISASPKQKLSSFLKNYLEIDESNLPPDMNLIHSMLPKGSNVKVSPFHPIRINPSIRLTTRFEFKDYFYTWRASIYLMSKDSPPQWFQLEIENSVELRKLTRLKNPVEFSERIKKVLRIKPVIGQRAAVDLNPINPH